MCRSSAEVGDQDLPQLGLLNLLLPVSPPAHHDEIVGTWYRLDLVIWVLGLENRSPSEGSPPIVIRKKDDEEETEAGEGDEG